MKRAAELQPHWPDRIATVLRSRRRGGRRTRVLRRALAAALVIAAGVIAVTGQRGPASGTPVLVVARDLPAGTVLSPLDLRTTVLTAVPDGALRNPAQATGRPLSGPVRRGEVLTDVGLVSADGPDPGPGRVAVPIRPADPGTVDLLNPGAHVAVLAVAENGQATVLATDAVVLSIPPPSKSEPVKRLVVLAVPVAVADRITAVGITGALALRFT